MAAKGAQFRPEVVLLDLGMSGMDGFETCRAIRAEPWNHRAAIVALTGWGQDSDRQRSKEAGFDADLVKPASPEALEEVFRAGGGGGLARD